MPTRHPPPQDPHIPHNLGLYRLAHFTGRRTELRALHGWLTQPIDGSALAITGKQGNGKSTLATAAAWAAIRHFSDGVIWVGPAGQDSFRLYDIVRTLDTVLGTTISRMSVDRWEIAILEQLYGRKRLLILDELSGAREAELQTLVEIIGRLHESDGHSRVLLINRESNPMIAELVGDRELTLGGLALGEVAGFVAAQAPQRVQSLALRYVHELHHATGGRPLSLRLLFGLLLDYSWDETRAMIQDLPTTDGAVQMRGLAAIAVENYAAFHFQAGPLLERMVSAAGGATFPAVFELFWGELGSQDEVAQLLAELTERALLEQDHFRQRVIIQPVVRRYLAQGAAMMGENWLRRHAIYYQRRAEDYQRLPIEQWTRVDVEWGNIHYGADWCLERATRIWEADPLFLIAAPIEREKRFYELIDQLDPAVKGDLRLLRNYALSLAPYGFWRHPPGILRWLAAGALCSLALEDVISYAWLLMNIGRQLFFQGEVEQAVGFLDRALTLFQEQDSILNQAFAHTDLGTARRILNQLPEALDHFWNAFEYVAQLGNQPELATAYMNLGSAYFSLQNYARALDQHRKALRIAQRLGDGQRAASAYNNIGLVLESMNELTQAKAAYEQALAGFQQADDLPGISTCYNNLGSVCYTLKLYDEAAQWYSRDLALSSQRGSWVDMAATLHNLGHVASEQGDPRQAIAYFVQSRDLYAAFRLDEYVQEEEEMIAYLNGPTGQG